VNVVSSVTDPIPPRKRPIRLQTARDARKLLSKLINGVYRHEISPDRAAKMGFLLGVFLKSVETDEFERRLNELELVKQRRTVDVDPPQD